MLLFKYEKNSLFIDVCDSFIIERREEMPIYEFECKKCGRRFEELVRRFDEEIICEVCGSKNLKKLMSEFSGTVKEQSSGTGCCPTGTCSLG